MTQSRWQEEWMHRYYRGRPEWRDGTTEFHELCARIVHAGDRILEVGAGPTNRTSAFLARLGEVYGVDIDPEVRTNKDLTGASLIVDGRIDHADGTFPVAVSDFVVEHVRDPQDHLSEIHRVLRPGGRYVFRTPNLWHYVALFSWLTPHRVHVMLANRLRGLPADSHEPWPTVYAMNRPARVREYARRTAFEVEEIRMVEKEPSYAMIARPLFLSFMVYERLVNSSPLLGPFRAGMFVVLRRLP